jgi:quercetin dioxygenase-like cupin family protein
MNHPFCSRLMLAIFISASFIACKGKDKAKENEATTDSTKTSVQTTDNSNNTAGMDAATVAPNFYKVVADTLGIRMVEVNYKPGDSSAMHWHPDYAIYAAQGGKVTFYAKDGSSNEVTLPTGVTLIKPAEWHAAKNTGTNPIKVILVEVNRSGAMGTNDASTDATKVSPELYKTANDTMGIRVIEVNYKPGQSSGVHWHPDAALYVIDPGTGEFTGKDGSKRVLDLKKGMAMIVPSDTHSVKNIGKTTMRAILVEVNRAMK